MRMLERVLVTGLAVTLTGCGSNADKQAPNAETNTGSSPLTAPVDYLGAIGKAQQSAIKTVDTASLNKAIQLFQVEHERYPRSLEELVQEKLLPRIPEAPAGTKLSYDPQTGTVKVVKQ
jgi:hypothetical protein